VGKLDGSLTDARRACSARRDEPSAPVGPTPAATRARATAPIVLAPFAIALAAVGAAACGLSFAAVVAVALSVAVAGAAVAHRTVSSVLAGVVLVLARPYEPGERLRVHLPELGGPTEAEVLRIGLVTTTLCTGAGVLVLPNRRLLAPAPRPAD
jgi:Mechanosensitive ion channel